MNYYQFVIMNVMSHELWLMTPNTTFAFFVLEILWITIKTFLLFQSIANWSIVNLKPAPPLRPAIVNTNSSSNAVLTSTKKSQPTYEEDALVLRVIEAYCVAYQNPTRNALHSGWLQTYFQFFRVQL